MIQQGLTLAAAAIIIGALVALVIGMPVMWLWDWIIVPMGLPKLGFWKSVGLTFLIRILWPSPSSSSSN